MNLFSTSDFSILDHPLAAVIVGAFAAALVIGLFRKFRKMVFIGVTGLILTTVILVWQLSG